MGSSPSEAPTTEAQHRAAVPGLDGGGLDRGTGGGEGVDEGRTLREQLGGARQDVVQDDGLAAEQEPDRVGPAVGGRREEVVDGHAVSRWPQYGPLISFSKRQVIPLLLELARAWSTIVR